MKVLEAQHLHKTYRDKGQAIPAVQDVSLTLAPGEVLAFLGPNGAGKTTTIKMLAGLIRPDAGWVRICDRDPHTQPAALCLLGAVLEGNRNVYWRLTPEENLEYFGVLRGLSQRVARQRSQALLDRFGLLAKRRATVQSLSRGMQQKVAIAVALMHQPQLLLLDEPTLGLDVTAAEDVKRLVREIAAEGCAILLTTHQLAIAEELADRVAIIRRGAIVAEASTQDLLRQFSGDAYYIETEHPITAAQREQLLTLGAVIHDAQTVHLTVADQIYPALEILKPLPLRRVTRDQANLTDVFLKLVHDEPHV